MLAAARALTTPLLPDDYIELMNPMWTTRELRGEIVDIRPETEDTSTIVIRPSAKWLGHWPGQYLRIGVEIDGRRHWRAYSLTSDPNHPDGLISVTVKHVPEGKLSPYFTRKAEIGTMVFLGGVEGECDVRTCSNLEGRTTGGSRDERRGVRYRGLGGCCCARCRRPLVLGGVVWGLRSRDHHRGRRIRTASGSWRGRL